MMPGFAADKETIEMIRDLRPEDRDAWAGLWLGYQNFYRIAITPEIADRTWVRLLDGREPMHGMIAFLAGQPVGIVHFIYHRSTWSTADVCYLEDLYVAPDARGRGIASALIGHVQSAALAAGADSVYWLTHETNKTAMRLYDKLAERTGFVHYRAVGS